MELKEIELEDRILEKARELFFFFGIKSITMDDISKHLGISKETLSTHYKDKGELVHLIMGDLLTKHAEEMLKVKEIAENAVEEVVLHAQILYAVFRDLKPNVFFEMEKYFPELDGQFSDHSSSYMAELTKENLQRGITEQLYREDLEVDFTAQIRLNQLISAFDEKAYELVEFNVPNIINKLTLFYLNSICNTNGKQLIAKYLK